MYRFSKIVDAADRLGMAFRRDEPLCDYTTFKVGGYCPLLIEMDTAEHTAELIRLCHSEKIPYYIIGRGSNLLVDDRGISSVIFNMGRDFSDVFVNGNEITCEAGASLNRVCRTALENSLSGMEFAYGIPGSVGGAVYMNAGAYGGEISDVIVSCKAVDREGNLRKFTHDEMELSYRHSIFSHGEYIILEAVFRLTNGERESIQAKMNELLQKRRDKQPIEFPSAGSTFKRPQGNYAAALIEQCGLKGRAVGGAEVSSKHSGFIINRGGATFDDIIELIRIVKTEVYEKTGYMLEIEPLILSDREINTDIYR